MIVSHSEDISSPLPSIFLSHGAPPLADNDVWTRELSSWGGDIPRPESILVVSAHWESAPLTIGATTTVPLLYDFYGFDAKYYDVVYEAPGAPALAESVTKLLSKSGRTIQHDPNRGLDHGAYVPLVEMYPEQDIPVLQVSMPTLDPHELFEIGRALAPLRDEGVLIVGSGFSTHNLVVVNFGEPDTVTPPSWSSEFDHWLDEALTSGDIDSLIDFGSKAPAALLAHPRTEHFAPLFVALGSVADHNLSSETIIDGFWHGLSKRSIQLT